MNINQEVLAGIHKHVYFVYFMLLGSIELKNFTSLILETDKMHFFVLLPIKCDFYEVVRFFKRSFLRSSFQRYMYIFRK